MDKPELQHLRVNGIDMRVATQGSGPLVLLCHGFPELWCSWRQQIGCASRCWLARRGT